MILRVLLALIVALAALPGSAEARRVALVIANSQYQHTSSLRNPAADARIVASSLDEAGFDDVSVFVDLGKVQMEQKLRDFSALADGADVAVIYYAGHGMEAGGTNYLIPTDARLARDRDLELEATRLDTALLMAEGARLRIVILDACRNNPFEASMQRTARMRSVGRGLAPVEPEGETLVVYAAKGGQTAADGAGVNSPFATALSRRIREPGLEISLLFRSVRDDVLRETGRAQEPFTYGSLSSSAFYFVAPQNVNITVGNAPVQTATTDNSAVELAFWQGALAANSERAYRSYLTRFPQGSFKELAEENISRTASLAAQGGGAAANLPVPGVTTAPGIAPSSNGAGIGGLSMNVGGLIATQSAVAAAGSADPQRLGAEAARSLGFRVDQGYRRQLVESFLKQMEATDATMGQFFRLTMTQNDIFTVYDTGLRDYGLTTSNLADSTAVLMDSLRDAANGFASDGTRQQAQGLRNQMAYFLSLNPASLPATDRARQEISDTMLLTAFVMSATMELMKQGSEADRRQFADATAAMAQQQLGIDLRRVVLTDSGYDVR